MGHKLLPSQRNGVFKLVQNNGFQPTEFEWRIDSGFGGVSEPLLFHTPSGYWFRFGVDLGFGGVTSVVFSPAKESIQATVYKLSWEEILRYANAWLGYLKRETEIPDLWDAVTRGNDLLQGEPEQATDNAPFTPNELPHVRKCLEEIKAYIIKTKELTEAQRKIVDARFDHMEEAATRMGRKDWLSLVVGNLMGVAFSLALNGDSTRDLFGFAALALKSVRGAVMYLASPH